MNASMPDMAPVGFRLIGITGIALLAACTDATNAPVAVAPSGSPLVQGTAPAVGDAKDFDHFSADVSIRSKVDNPSGGARALQHEARFRVERARAADGAWSTSFEFDPPVADGVGKPHGAPRGVKRVEMRDDGAVRAVDFAGNPVDMSAGLNAYESVRRGSGLEAKGRPPFAGPPEQPAARTARAQEARAWVEGMILTTEARQHARDALERRFGKPQGKVRGLDRYTGQRHDFTLELLVDPATGLVAEQTVARQGKVAQRVTFGYSKVDGDVYVPSTARAEFPARAGETVGQIVDVAISNVRVAKRGGV